MNRHVCTSLTIAGVLTLAGITALYAQAPEAEQLKAAVKSLDQTVQELKQKVVDLEKQSAAVPKQVVARLNRAPRVW